MAQQKGEKRLRELRQMIEVALVRHDILHGRPCPCDACERRRYMLALIGGPSA